MQTYIENHLEGYEVELFDFNIGSVEEFEAMLREGGYRYVGVSLRNVDDVNIFTQNSFLKWYAQIVEMIRRSSSATVIVGGAGFSIFPRLIFDTIKPDYGIYSEGEQAIVELISKLDSVQDVSEIEGLVTSERENNRTNFVSAIKLSLDEKLVEYYWAKGGMIGLQTKRGCPLRCIYCSYPIIEGTKVRTLDVDVVVENIRRMVEGGIKYIFFTDSIFNIDNRYNRELAQKIIDSGIKVSWMAYFAPYNLTYEDLELFKRSGLTHIEFGTESFSDTQLKNYGKPFTFEDVERVSRYCYDLNIFYAHFLILGGYGETEQTLKEGFENSKRIHHSVFFPYVGMRVYPKTRLSEISLAEGLFDNEDELINPIYYVSKAIDIESIKSMAEASGGKWVFADSEPSPLMEKLRERGRKGPLWELLRY